MLARIDPCTFHAQTWANGAGRTTELAAGPARDDWRWRISMAEVDAEGAFSALPGVRRQIAPLDGRLTLRFADGSERSIHRLETFAFDGAAAPFCSLPDGAGRHFNLMLREGAEGQLVVRPLNGGMIVPRGVGQAWFVYMLAGDAAIRGFGQSIDLARDEALWIDHATDGRIEIEGGGEIALVRIDQE